MNKYEIVDIIEENFGPLSDHVTLIGEGALVIEGIIDSCDYITLNLDNDVMKMIASYVEKEINGETKKFYTDSICICHKNMSVYKVVENKYSFKIQSISAAVTCLRDEIGSFRYSLMNKEVITEKDKMELKKLLNVFRDLGPRYARYKDSLKKKK